MRSLKLIPLLVLLLAGCERTPADTKDNGEKWKAGVNYEILPGGTATATKPGKIEVMEFFAYSCPYCYRLDSEIKEWAENRQADLVFTQVHIAGDKNLVHRAHTRLLHSLRRLGGQNLNNEIFKAIHEQDNLLADEQSEAAALPLQAEFVKAHGINPGQFKAIWGSAEVTVDLKHNIELTEKYLHRQGVQGVVIPTIVVNGRYRIEGTRVKSIDQMLELADYLIDKELRGAT